MRVVKVKRENFGNGGKFKLSLPLIILVGLFLFAVFASQVSFQSFTGTLDTDLLLLSGSPIYYVLGDGETPAKYVRATFLLGGNDIAYIGSYENETTPNAQISGGTSANFSTANFTFSAKKEKFNLNYPINTTSAYYAYQVIYNSNVIERAVPLGSNDVTVRQQLANEKFASCKSESAFTPFGFAYEEMSSYNVGIEQRARIRYICLGKITGDPTQIATVYQNGFGTIGYDFKINFELKNNKGVTSSIDSITQTDQTAEFFAEGRKVGWLKVVGLLSGFTVVPQASGFFALNQNGLNWVISQSNFNTFKTNFDNLQNNYSFLTSPRKVSSVLSVISEADATRNSFNSLVSSKNSRLNNIEFQQNVSNALIFTDVSYTAKPQLVLNVEGEWLGIKELVPNLSVSCLEGFKGTTQSNLQGHFAVSNVGSVYTSFDVRVDCAGLSFARSGSLNAEQSVDFYPILQFQDAFVGNCVASLNYGSQSKSCVLGANVVVAPVGYCGDGIVSAGETCVNCKQDFDVDPAYGPEFCNPEIKCGNGVIDVGEDCVNCKVDIEAVNGVGYCTLPKTCGNGVIDEGEECDGSLLNNKTCTSFPPLTSGTLKCNASCKFDKSECIGGGGGIPLDLIIIIVLIALALGLGVYYFSGKKK